MTIAEILEKMIAYSNGSIHDIDHFIKVWAYAKTIGELEGLDPGTQYILEAAAIVHDIACPLCREKYGSTEGKLQEREGVILAGDFFRNTDLTEETVDRIVYLVGHHHTLSGIEGMDYQILVEADYIVNASEQRFNKSVVDYYLKDVFVTKAGKKMAEDVLSKILLQNGND